MHIYLVDSEMLLCMPMEMIIVGPNLKTRVVISMGQSYWKFASRQGCGC